MERQATILSLTLNLLDAQPGPDAFEVVPNSSLIVARTAYKDNKSKYTINHKTSSYTEATTLLKDRGIDLTHKRFLILQVRTFLLFETWNSTRRPDERFCRSRERSSPSLR